MIERRWLTVSETAALLHAHSMTIRSWINEGRIKASRIGKRFIRIDGKALNEMLETTEGTGHSKGRMR